MEDALIKYITESALVKFIIEKCGLTQNKKRTSPSFTIRGQRFGLTKIGMSILALAWFIVFICT